MRGPSSEPNSRARTGPASFAVIGAGMSGLMCARTLNHHGHLVEVFEKSRGAGGRASTRHNEPLHFDHGAQYFTVRDQRFRQLVESWRAVGLVAPWLGRIAEIVVGSISAKEDGIERMVAVPGMSSLARHLANGLKVRYQTRVVEIVAAGDRWRLMADDGTDLGLYDGVVVSAPAPQTAALLETAAPELAERTRRVVMRPCWAVMASFDGALDLPFDGAFVRGGPLAWVARNASKPKRPAGYDTWVLHASPEWSERHLDDPPAAVEAALMGALGDAVGECLPWPVHLAAHLWRFALPDEPLVASCVMDPDLAIAACGDWCGGPRVEGAVLSGLAAARELLAVVDPVEIGAGDLRIEPAKPAERVGAR